MSEETKKIELGREGLYDARKLGVPKMLVLGVQHTFAMFGATVLVPILTGISVSTALLLSLIHIYTPKMGPEARTGLRHGSYRGKTQLLQQEDNTCVRQRPIKRRIFILDAH